MLRTVNDLAVGNPMVRFSFKNAPAFLLRDAWGCRTKNSPTLWQGFHCKYMNPRHSPHPMPKAVFVPLSVAKQKKKAELFCKERLWVYNYVMKTTKIIQKDYTSSILNYQFKLPLEMEVLIEDNDPVRLLSVFVEGLELTDLYNSYQKIKKNQVSLRQMFKIVIYAAMNHIYSSRVMSLYVQRLIV